MRPDDDFIPRSLTPSIIEAMGDTPAVRPPGPRRCGKSTLAIRTGELRNTSVLANESKITRVTVDRYLQVPERPFLIRRLPSRQRNEARRVIKAPEYHVVDSGLAATPSNLQEDAWRDDRSRAGHLLESFVVQQVIAQAGWTDGGLRFYHYRDEDKLEVNLVMVRGRATWGIEVEAAASVSNRDGRGLRRLAEACGDDFRGAWCSTTVPTRFPSVTSDRSPCRCTSCGRVDVARTSLASGIPKTVP